MATIQTGSNTSYYSIQRFLGVNESLDGDTQLQLGEASIMENWRVTPQYHLRIRPGLKTLWKFTGPVRGLWCGDLAGRHQMLAAADGKVWQLTDGGGKTSLASLTDSAVTFLPFSNKLYILNGHEYLVWYGTGTAKTV